jgi:hypothetical protein
MNERSGACIVEVMTSSRLRFVAVASAALTALALASREGTAFAQNAVEPVAPAPASPPATAPVAAPATAPTQTPSGAPSASGPASQTPSTVPTPPPNNSGLPSELAPKDPEADSKAGKEKDEDGEGSRLTEIFWINGELGAAYANMQQFSAENLALTNPSGGGFMAGVGAGIRIVFISLGARLRWQKLSPFNLVQANGELLFKLPISKVDVIIGGHGGYSGVGTLNDLFASNATTNAALADSVNVKGWNAGIDLGFDYFINRYFSLGLGLTGDFLFLQRPKSGLPAGFDQLPPEVQAEYQNSDVYKYDGKSVGFGFGAALRVGFHLGP